jgi:hypothetical protein
VLRPEGPVHVVVVPDKVKGNGIHKWNRALRRCIK